MSSHTDFGCLTVLFQDPVGGLEVLNRDGESPRYPPVRAGDYVLDRYAGAFAYRRQNQ